MKRTRLNFPNKTSLLVFNPPKGEIKNLILCGQAIVRADSFKYLGTEVKNNCANRQHITKRAKSVLIGLDNLTSASIINEEMDINSKMRLFGTYIKPLIYYGIKALDLNLGDIDELKKIEGNAIKKIIGILFYFIFLI